MCNRLDTITIRAYEGQTDRQTSCHGIVRTLHTRRAVKTKQFTAMVSIYDLYEAVHGLFKEPIILPLKSKMAQTRHLENRHDVIFLPYRRSDLDKISQTGVPTAVRPI